MKHPIALVLLMLVAGCGGASTTSSPESGEAAPAPAQETLLSKDDILGVLTRHNLNPQTVPAPDVSKKMAEALAGIPAGTSDRFLLGIDNHGLMALGFATIEDAKRMESLHKGDGFRHHNWYFGGQVPADVFNKVKDALRKG